MIVQTGPVLAEIPRKNPVAVSYLKDLLDQIDRFPDSISGGERTEITALVL